MNRVIERLHVAQRRGRSWSQLTTLLNDQIINAIRLDVPLLAFLLSTPSADEAERHAELTAAFNSDWFRSGVDDAFDLFVGVGYSEAEATARCRAIAYALVDGFEPSAEVPEELLPDGKIRERVRYWRRVHAAEVADRDHFERERARLLARESCEGNAA